jgi:hypothetical protein
MSPTTLYIKVCFDIIYNIASVTKDRDKCINI